MSSFHAVIHPAEQLKNIGYKVRYCPVDQNGCIKIEEFRNLITTKTKFVSIMFANNEIGSIQNIKYLVEIVREKEKEFNKKIYFHTDAVQAVGKIKINVKEKKFGYSNTKYPEIPLAFSDIYVYVNKGDLNYHLMC